jgi:hypothetical protein
MLFSFISGLIAGQSPTAQPGRHILEHETW